MPLAAILACGAAAPTASPATSSDETVLTSQGNYRIETDTTQSNFNTGNFTMPHKVRFYRPGTDATADSAQGNFKAGTVVLIGNVVVHDSGDAPEASGQKAYRGNGPATLTCDRLEVDSKKKIYTAIGNVHFTQADETGTSQRATLDRGTGVLHLEGDVKLTQAGSSMSAQTVVYNLDTKDVTVHGAPVIIKQPVPTAAPASPRLAPKKG